MIFLNEKHKELWTNEIQNIIENHHDLDVPMLILTGMPFLYSRLKPYIHPTYIDFHAILDELRLSSGEVYMIELASNLYNGAHPVNLHDLLGRCDSEMRLLAEYAINAKIDSLIH